MAPIKNFLIISSGIVLFSVILMSISAATPHWVNTKMNFKTSTIYIYKGYRGLFKICQEMLLRGNVKTKCSNYKDLSVTLPEYWIAVQALLFMNIVGSLIFIIASLLLAFVLKSRAVSHLFLLSFFQVLPFCFGLIALAMFTSKTVDETGKNLKSKALLSSSFGYSFILGWCSCFVGLIAMVVCFIFTLVSYRSERLQLIAQFQKLENQ